MEKWLLKVETSCWYTRLQADNASGQEKVKGDRVAGHAWCCPNLSLDTEGVI